jgi:5-methyltetrahydropteroyltriglutamate--homocysteine methyltransferase
MTHAPFRADHVGSLLRPAEVREARRKRAAGEIGVAELQAVEDAAIRAAIARQESVGLRSITDGEFRRDTWVFDFLRELEGTRIVEREVPTPQGAGAAVQGTPRKVPLTTVAGKLRYVGHSMIRHFAFVKAHTRATPKITIPSPTMLLSVARNWRDVVDSAAYTSIEDICEDLAVAYRAVLRDFYDAGCRYLQLDDVNMAYLCDSAMREALMKRGDDPDRMLSIWVRMLHGVLSDRPPDLKVTTHLCRGNFRSSWFAQGGYERIADVLFNQTDYDGYFLEYDTERAGGFEPLRFVPKGKKRIVLGLVTTKTGTLEEKDVIRQRIDAASRYVSLEQLCLSPQCGFASTLEGNILSEDAQWAKLAEIVEIARSVWPDA